MLGRLITYLRNEGLLATVVRSWNKIFFHSKSQTVFLKHNGLLNEAQGESDIIFEVLTDENRSSFESIKFWNFINTDDYINNMQQNVLLIKKDNEFIAYAAELHERTREIHNLGCFLLNSGEGWIGPVYVVKKYRRKGVNRLLLVEQIKRLQSKGVYEIFSAINSRNTASLKSFKKVGFVEIGSVDSLKRIVGDPKGIIAEKFF